MPNSNDRKDNPLLLRNTLTHRHYTIYYTKCQDFHQPTHHRLARAWPGVLQKLVGKKYKSTDFGHSGATLLKKGNLPYWTTPQFKAATKFDPNIVIIMLGTNDTKPKNWKKYGS